MNVGGFFASLVLTTEKKSFDEGVAGIKRIGEGIKEADEHFGSFVKKSIQGLIAVTAAAIGAGGAISMIQSKALLSAQVAGMNTEAYTNWANAMKLVIGTADGFDAGAAKLQKTFTNIVSDPQAYEKLAQNLALISRSLNINDLSKMSNSDRIKTILDAASNGGDRGFEFSANLVGDVLGPQFTTLLYGLREQKATIGQKLTEADSLRAVSTGSQRDAMGNAQSLNRLGVAGEQVGDVALTAMLKALKPTLDGLTEFLVKNRDVITKAFETLGVILNKVLEALGPIAKFIGEVAGKGLDVISDVVTGGPNKAISNLAATIVSGDEEVSYMRKHPEIQKKIEAMGQKYGFGDTEWKSRIIGDIQRLGPKLTSGITSSDVSDLGIRATTHVGSITVNVTPELLQRAAGLFKNDRGKLSIFGNIARDQAYEEAALSLLFGATTD